MALPPFRPGLADMTNIGPMSEPLSAICTITGEVCGSPTRRFGRNEAAGVTIYAPLHVAG